MQKFSKNIFLQRNFILFLGEGKKEGIFKNILKILYFPSGIFIIN